MFNRVGIIVYVIRRNMQLRRQIQLPETMHFDNALSTDLTSLRQSPQVTRLLHIALIPQALEDVNEVLALKFPSADNLVNRSLKVKMPAFLAELIQRFQNVFIIYRFTDASLLEKPADNSTSGCEEK